MRLKTTMNLNVARPYVVLIKPRPTMLAWISALVGYIIGSGNYFDWIQFLNLAWGIWWVGCSANAWNQCLEFRYDSMMKRTASRPLVNGELKLKQGIIFALISGLIGLGHLFWAIDTLTGFLATALLIIYVFIYTPLKRRHQIALYVGAIAGALPPCIGWAAVQGRLGLEAMILFAIVFFWQIPHFLAISWIYRDDYFSGGFDPLVYENPKQTKSLLPTSISLLMLILASLLPVALYQRSFIYGIFAFLAGLYFIQSNIAFIRNPSKKTATKVVDISAIYLSFVLFLMICDKFAF